MKPSFFTAGIVAMAAIWGLATASCTFLDLKREVTNLDASFVLLGQIVYPSTRRGPVVVCVFMEKDGKQSLIRYGFPEDTGHFSFLVEGGAYYIGAFEDLNENLRHDTGEWSGFYGTPDKIVTPSPMPSKRVSRVVKNLDIRLLPEAVFDKNFDMIPDLEVEQMPLFRVGTIAGLEDALFDDAHGGTGYWKPLTFIKQFGMGVYFLEPYDPERIPVLFVHGAIGTPRIWRTMVSHLDKRRYQAWFYYYPSGVRLEASANVLHGILRSLHDKYRFDRLCITAHSMGGLVCRSAILPNRNHSRMEYVGLFVSLSTAWGGIRIAQKGLEKAPTTIPSWHDVAPESDFIRTIYDRSLSPDVPFYLFFSHRGDCSLFMENNDGSVELDSELDYRAQKDAAGIYGFNENHVGILSSPEMIDQYLALLNTAMEQTRHLSK